MAAPDSPPKAIGGTWTAPLCHEDVFIERYQSLRGWARRLAGNLTDADDLLHDAFLQFVLRRRDLSEIESIDAYLYGMLRRLRLSKRRAALRAREDPLEAIDYDTAELSLRMTDPRDTLRLHEELQAVCAYACRRKDTSKSGSVLLLRFFHGFFPGEIARILNCPLRGANDWLRIARREAREYLADSGQVRIGLAAHRSNGGGDYADPADPLDELRSAIWAARRGECSSAQSLARIYGGGTETLSCRTLAHVVSCRDCLARVTTLLGMRGPVDRDPHDMLRQDTSWRFPDRPSSNGGAGGLSSQLRRWEDALRTVREHMPRELRVAANGLPLGTCSVNASECAFTLAVNIDEPLDFVEVFSEQGVRLMLWEVQPAPIGDVDQADRIELADGRSLSVAAHFNGHWPSLEIAYRDPAWSADAAASEATPRARVASFPVRHHDFPTSTIWQRLRAHLAFPLPWSALKPALAILVLVAAVGIWARAPWRPEPVSAAEILTEARSLEIRTASAPNVAVHRVLKLEERRLPDGVVIMRRRIEGWHSGSRRITARRVYDDRGRLVAAEWVHPDGARTVYTAGQAPRVNRAADPPGIESSSIWQWEPSATGFEQLVGGSESAVVREEHDRYVLTYRAELDPGRDGLVQATLVVAKEPLRPISQTLVVREHGESRQFDFAEATRAEMPEASVPDRMFQPEPELLGPTAAPAPAVAAPAASDAIPRPIVDPRAVDRLEVDLLFVLHRLEGCLTTPAEIATADGTLAVTVIAASEECRARIRRAVGTGARDGVRAAVTFALGRTDVPTHVTESRTELEALPAYRAIIKRFAAAGLAPTTDATARDDAAVIAARAFGTWALEHSWRAYDEALHLNRLTVRWSVDAVEVLDMDRVARWQDVVRDHARRFRRETEALHAQLRSILLTSADLPRDDVSADEAVSVRGIEDVGPAVARLCVLAAAQHEAVRHLLDPALKTPRVSVDPAALIAALKDAEAQAAWFDEPWIMPERTTAFGIVGPPRHISMTAR
jgi:DNA-directed RNA polymerase specialized sigma24 family protein